MAQETQDEPVDVAEATATAPTTSHARRRRSRRRWLELAVGGDVVSAVVAAAIAVRVPDGPAAVSYAHLSLMLVVLWPAFLVGCDAYELRTSLFGVEELRCVLRAGLVLLAALVVTNFFVQLDLSRGFVAIIVATTVGVTMAWRLVLRLRWDRRAVKGIEQQRAVALGPAADLELLVSRLRAEPTGVEVVAFVADDLEPDDPVPPGLSRLPRLSDRAAIQTYAASGEVVDLLIRAGRPHPEELPALGRRAREVGATVAIAPDDGAGSGAEYMPLGQAPVLVVRVPHLKPAAVVVKAVMDRLLAVAFLILLSPVMLITAIVIVTRDGRPILYRHERIGRDHRQFRCWKFRTMIPDADALRSGLLEENQAHGPLFKLHTDPRLTTTGGWLRRHSLDELPQLWCVLRGDMSIVGPRPPLPGEAETYNEQEARRLTVKPGLTGLWQVEGRSDLPWDESVYLDLLYVDHWSPLLDLVIIARTAKHIIWPIGAY